MSAAARNRFYPLIALVMALLIITGFSRTYYLRFIADLPPLSALLQLHALLFTAWLGLFSSEPGMLAAGAQYLRLVGPAYGFFGLGLSLYFASQGAGRYRCPPRAHLGLHPRRSLRSWAC